ncbi:MAG: MATE family efflux transporter [Candidatus Diapherotrites archaeon]|nr:MATE family efflux transporter [Candidatus Diapherotrites archaeon]MBT4597163.1 MATE family efflux transporter [Candidatus Diapherotrites archaeon]
MKSKFANLTEMPITKAIILLAIPILITNLLQTVYQITDTFWVGQLGKEAVAAVSISFPVVFLIVALGSGIGMAGSILVAQYKGKNDQKNIDFISTQTIVGMVFFGIIFTIIGLLLAEPIITLMGVEANVFPLALSYLLVSFLTTVFTFTYSAFASLLRGIGEVKIPMIIVLVTVILNFFLDPIFIFGYGIIPASGVAGAAWATLITTAISALLGMIILLRGKRGIYIRKSCCLISFKTQKRLLRIGWPSSIEFFSHSVGMIVITFIAAAYGTVILASFGLGLRLFSFVFMPALSVSIAVSAIVGQQIGAKKFDLIGKTLKKASAISFVALTALGILLFVLSELLVAIFVPGELEVIRNASEFIKVMAVTFGFLGIQTVMLGAIRGAGATKKAMTLSILLLAFQILIAATLPFYLGTLGLWLAFPGAIMISFFISIIITKRMDWKKARLV